MFPRRQHCSKRIKKDKHAAKPRCRGYHQELGQLANCRKFSRTFSAVQGRRKGVSFWRTVSEQATNILYSPMGLARISLETDSDINVLSCLTRAGIAEVKCHI